MNLFEKYIFLLNIIKESGKTGISFDEIAYAWYKKEETELSKRTFQHQKSKIEDLFDVNILCNRHTNTYYIENQETFSNNQVQNWILDTFSITSTLKEASSLRDRIIVNSVPSSHVHLTDILEAMKSSREITMLYHSFDQPEQKSIQIAPYFVKLHRNRWYVYGVKPGKQIKLYALDRIKSLSITDTPFFMPKNFSVEDTLHTVYGVSIYDNIPPQTITIKAYDNKPKYLDSLPLHHSQQKISENKDFTTYELRLAPTPEFINEIIHQGNDIEIVSPLPLRKEIINKINQIKKRYSQTKI